MGKYKILSGFALLYVVFCAIAILILRYIYNDSVSIGILNWINLPSLYFFYVTVYKPYAKNGLFDVPFTFDRRVVKSFGRNFLDWLFYYIKRYGIVEVLYLAYLFYHAFLESSMGYSLNNSLYIFIHASHLGFWLWMWAMMSMSPARLLGYMLMRKKVSSEGYTPRHKDTAAQSSNCCAESR